MNWRQLSRPGRTGRAVPAGYGHGFLGINWRRGEHLASLDEWGLGGRTFGTWITWFLLGGDLYTAYTFVAVPAAMFALGSVAGFFAVPYTIILYPIIFVYMARLWSVSYRHGYVTAADFVTRSLRFEGIVSGSCDHWHSGDHAVYRTPTRGYPGCT